MKNISMALAMVFALTAIGCSNDSTDTTASSSTPAATEQTASSAELTPEQLGELGAAIEKTPNDAQRLLSEKGLSEDSFETAVRKVSEDPEASKRYADAYKRAKA